MAIGKRKSGDFLPVAKYDARNGTMRLEDRILADGRWETKTRDITKKFRATFDMENLLRGWIKFPKGAAPETRLVPVGRDYDEPPGDDWREGARILMKMDASIDGSVRELMSTALALWNGLDALHDAYLADVGKHPGALPVVDLDHAVETKTANGPSFTPVFKIVGWLPRPDDLPAEMAKSAKPKPRATAKPTADADLDDPILALASR